ESNPDSSHTPRLTAQYGRMDIVAEMKALKASLNALAHLGHESLTPQDREALAVGHVIISAMIRQSLIIAECNRPGHPYDPQQLKLDNHEYWQGRIQQITQSAQLKRNEQDNDAS